MKVYGFLFEQSNIQKKSRPHSDRDQIQKLMSVIPWKKIIQIYTNDSKIANIPFEIYILLYIFVSWI